MSVLPSLPSIFNLSWPLSTLASCPFPENYYWHWWEKGIKGFDMTRIRDQFFVCPILCIIFLPLPSLSSYMTRWMLLTGDVFQGFITPSSPGKHSSGCRYGIFYFWSFSTIHAFTFPMVLFSLLDCQTSLDECASSTCYLNVRFFLPMTRSTLIQGGCDC